MPSFLELLKAKVGLPGIALPQQHVYSPRDKHAEREFSLKLRMRYQCNLDFVDNKINGCILTVVNKEQFTWVRRLAKYRVRATATIVTHLTFNRLLV